MKKRICAVGTVCALLLTACGKGGSPVITSGDKGVVASGAGGQPSGVLKVETVDSQVITVSSRETVKVVPDLAEIIYAVTTQDKDAGVCQKENKEKINQLVDTLKELGVEEKSIQTSFFDLNPRYDWENDGAIIGYEAVTQVTVKGIQLDQAGLVI